MEKICPNCHRPNTSEAAFCRHCATPLPSSSGGGGGRPFAEHQQQQNWQQNPQWNQSPVGGGGGQMQGNFVPAGGTGGASGRAIASLILAICALVLCCGFFTGIPAAILGWMEMTAIKEGRSSPQGLVMAQIGLWGGIALSVLSAIFFLLYMLALMAGGGF